MGGARGCGPSSTLRGRASLAHPRAPLLTAPRALQSSSRLGRPTSGARLRVRRRGRRREVPSPFAFHGALDSDPADHRAMEPGGGQNGMPQGTAGELRIEGRPRTRGAGAGDGAWHRSAPGKELEGGMGESAGGIPSPVFAQPPRPPEPPAAAAGPLRLRGGRTSSRHVGPCRCRGGGAGRSASAFRPLRRVDVGGRQHAASSRRRAAPPPLPPEAPSWRVRACTRALLPRRPRPSPPPLPRRLHVLFSRAVPSPPLTPQPPPSLASPLSLARTLPRPSPQAPRPPRWQVAPLTPQTLSLRPSRPSSLPSSAGLSPFPITSSPATPLRLRSSPRLSSPPPAPAPRGPRARPSSPRPSPRPPRPPCRRAP